MKILGLYWFDIYIYTDLVEFLVEHGNDLYAQYPRSACMGSGLANEDNWSRAAHHVAYNLGFQARRLCRMDCTSLRHLSIELMGTATTDPCGCFCTTKSSGGCAPASLYARGVLDMRYDDPCLWHDTRPNRHVQTAVEFVSGAVQELEVDVRKTVAMTLIRSFTFSRLRMKHMCYKYRHSNPHFDRPEFDANGQSLENGGTFTRDILKGTFHSI